MNSNRDHIKVLLEKYVKGGCTAFEIEQIFDFIRKNPDDRLLETLIDEDRRKVLVEEPVSENISQSIWSSLQDKLGARESTQKQITQKRGVRYLYWKVAASIVFIAGCGLLFLFLKSSSMVTVATSYGEIREITLPDKSTVVLNGNSVLTYASDWHSDQTREVHLDGEGFFKVVHQFNHQKFWVSTPNNVKIEVLGTEFNVSNRRSKTQIVLHTGRIRLEIENSDKAPENIFMNSGEYVEVTPGSDIVRKQVNSVIYTSWKDKTLVFEDTPVQHILDLLADNYGIEVEIKDSTILNEKFTATYPADNVDVLLRALSRSFVIVVDDTAPRKRMIVGN